MEKSIMQPSLPRFCRVSVAVAGLWIASGAFGADGVTVVREGQQVSVKTEVYAAKVDADGALCSLVLEGVEFLAPPVEMNCAGQKRLVRAVSPCPLNNWYNPYDPAPLRDVKDNVVSCEGNGWKIDYTFLPETIELAWEGTPIGAVKVTPRGFAAGFPPAVLAINFAPGLQRACDPGNQGELGWPVNRPHEPGTFAMLAANGAGVIAEDATTFFSVTNAGYIPAAPNRLDSLTFRYDGTAAGPLKRRLKLFRKADLAHAVTMQIESPNPQHMFSKTDEVVFPVTVHTLYGNSLKGEVQFDGAPYVWKKPPLTSATPIEVGPDGTVTVQVKIRPPKPGHYTGLIRIADGQKPIYSQRLGFMFRPEEIPPAQPPADFDAFWDTTMTELDKIPLDLTLEEQKDKETPAGNVYKAQYRSWGGRLAWAWLYVPKADAKVPGKVQCPPVSVWQPGQAQPADGSLRIAVAIHGGDLKDYPAKPDFDYMNTGITSREAYMLRYSYCCLVRCFDIVKNHPKCNGEISIEGGSQGAGLSLVLAGLRNAKQAQGAAVALCRIDWTILGYAQWGPHAPAGEDPQKIAEVVRYFDPACFAHRIHTPLRFALGLFDFCAPAEGIFTAFNALPKDTPCQVLVDPYGGHFTLNAKDFYKGGSTIEVPRWQGTDADNKLVR